MRKPQPLKKCLSYKTYQAVLNEWLQSAFPTRLGVSERQGLCPLQSGLQQLAWHLVNEQFQWVSVE